MLFRSGNGLENNSLILLMHGWRGVWIGNEDILPSIPSQSRNLTFEKAWITAENCHEMLHRGLAAIGVRGAPDVVSIDIDGNDYYVAQALIDAGLRPDVLIVEYNGKFPPLVSWRVPYEPLRSWSGDDYHGASIQAYADLLDPAGYNLVACNLTGANAFFVDKKHAARFRDVPTELEVLFEPCDHNWFVQHGHPCSPRTIEVFLDG